MILVRLILQTQEKRYFMYCLINKIFFYKIKPNFQISAVYNPFYYITQLSSKNMKSQQTQQANQSINTPKSKTRSKPLPKLILKIDTWQKQSHGLFDYQSPLQKISKEDFTIQQSSRIFRNLVTRKTSVRQLKEETKPQPDRLQIFNLQYDTKTKSYLIKNTLSTQLDAVLMAQGIQSQRQVQKNKLFLSLVNNGPGHKLGVGDFIKLGRVELVVLEINNSQKTQSLDFEEIYGSKQYIFHMKNQLQGSCKICLQDKSTQTDPLVNPCNCKGTCGVIHLDCLKNWINNKVKRQISGKVKTYNFQKFSCEICKSPFPSMIRLQNGDQILLLNFQRPNSPYILIQQCSQTEQKLAKTLHFILPQEGHRVNMGRGQNCELNISDISVSRNHSYIVYQENHFFIHDDKSKFGTLLELKQNISVKDPVRLQHNGCSIVIEAVNQKIQRSKSGKRNLQKKS